MIRYKYRVDVNTERRTESKDESGSYTSSN